MMIIHTVGMTWTIGIVDNIILKLLQWLEISQFKI